MSFYLLTTPSRPSSPAPLSTTREHRGHVLVNCRFCGVHGILPRNLTGKLPVEILVVGTGNLGDLELAGNVLLASRKFRDIVTATRLTGIEFYPPVGFRPARGTPELKEMLRIARDEFDYLAIHITGRGGSIAVASGMKLINSCSHCGWREWTEPEHGLVIDERQWDGSDFFHIIESDALFLTHLAAQALRAAGLTNCKAVSAADNRAVVKECRC